jgi:hypothetical protein
MCPCGSVNTKTLVRRERSAHLFAERDLARLARLRRADVIAHDALTHEDAPGDRRA